MAFFDRFAHPLWSTCTIWKPSMAALMAGFGSFKHILTISFSLTHRSVFTPHAPHFSSLGINHFLTPQGFSMSWGWFLLWTMGLRSAERLSQYGTASVLQRAEWINDILFLLAMWWYMRSWTCFTIKMYLFLNIFNLYLKIISIF